MGRCIDELTKMREALAPRFRVIAADVPGSGKSGPQPRTYSSTYYDDDAQAAWYTRTRWNSPGDTN